MNVPKIGIVGGGPGGLVLACVLRRHGLEPVVFEREAHGAVRPQGGSLDMHADAGQYAIEAAGLTEAFRRIARWEDQESRVYGMDGVLQFLETDVAGKNRPEVDRGHLRQMLLDALPAGVVRWGHALRSARLVGNACELTFAQGAVETFDLVVGADGTWSRLRALVSDAQPVYSGVTAFEYGIRDGDARHPAVATMVGRGLTFALGDCKALIGHRDANAHLGMYAALRVPHDADAARLGSDAASRQSLMDKFAGWAPTLLEWIEAGDGPFAARPLWALPVGHRWQHRHGVTLLGDAAHVMSPFGGDGANLAMRDAAELAMALCEADWQGAVARYEEAMFARAQPCAAAAAGAVQEVFSAGALEHMVAMMRGHRTSA